MVVAVNNLLALPISSRETANAHTYRQAFELEFDYLCRSLRRLGVQGFDVEDLVHEVFLVLHGRWSDYDASRPLRPWLFGVVLRVASAHRRRLAREVPYSSFDFEDHAPQPDQVLGAQETRALVLAGLARVPLPRRAVLVLHDLDQVPIREVASALQIPLFTAYSRLRKGRKEFKAAIRAIQQREGRR